MEDYAFHCAKGSMGPDDKLDENAVKAFIEDMAPDCPYTAKEILKAFLS